MAATKTRPDTVFFRKRPPFARRGGAVFQGYPDYRLTFQEIQKLGGLKENWDSYGGAPISQEAQRRAVAFVTTLLTHLDRPVMPPSIGPSAGGGVVLRWLSEQYDVTLTFLAAGGEYSVVNRNTDEVVYEGEIGRPESLIRDVVKPFLVDPRS